MAAKAAAIAAIVSILLGCLTLAAQSAAVRLPVLPGIGGGDMVATRVISLSNDNLLAEFNLTSDDVRDKWKRLQESNARAQAEPTTYKPNTEIEQHKMESIKSDIVQNIGRTVPGYANPNPRLSDTDDTEHNTIYYAICSRANDNMSDRIGTNTSRMYFSAQMLSRLELPKSRVDSAVLRIYQKPQGRSPINCSDPSERVFFTVSVLVRRVQNGEVQLIKRNCDTVSRTINGTSWIELDAVEVIRHWHKARRNSTGGGTGPRATDLLLLIDVHDQERNELNASLYFEPTDCQASYNSPPPIPWAFFNGAEANLSERDLPHYPRLDLSIRQSFHLSDSMAEQNLRNRYVDRFQRLDQLRPSHNHHHHHHQHQHQHNRQSGDHDESAEAATGSAGQVLRRNGRHSNRRQRDQHKPRRSHSHRRSTSTTETTPDRASTAIDE